MWLFCRRACLPRDASTASSCADLIPRVSSVNLVERNECGARANRGCVCDAKPPRHRACDYRRRGTACCLQAPRLPRGVQYATAP
jgi:hypothetical protein